jgi:type VI secretion system ImpM family protein
LPNLDVNTLSEPPGWHGKLPSLGDFASRRLDAAVVEAWDEWLAGGLLALRESAPDGWLAAYLASPSWRFVLMPGVMPGEAGAQAWAGVLMPSVDRVGRYFPFTLLQALGDRPTSAQQMTSLWHWLGRLDELAGDALHEDWDVDRLEAEPAEEVHPGDVVRVDLDLDQAEELLPQVAQHLAQQEPRQAAPAQLRHDLEAEQADRVLLPPAVVRLHLPQRAAGVDLVRLLVHQAVVLRLDRPQDAVVSTTVGGWSSERW